MNWTFSESFAGIGAWGKAIKRVTKRHNDTCQLKWYAEIDKYASNAFAAIHDESEDKNIWDITKDIQVDPVDVFFYSPPCQTFSIAGKREGTNVDKGNLFYNALDKLKKAKPKYAIMENVKGLVTGDTKDDFNNMVAALREAGYFSYWKVLNSLDYGIPQNRERVFIISIRKDLYNQGKRFEFPKEIKLEKTLFDMLDDEVDKKYYLSYKKIKDFTYNDKSNFKGNLNYYNFGQEDAVYNIYTHSPTLTAEGANSRIKIYINGNIRILTPIEFFRLQGFEDKDYEKAIDSFRDKYNINSETKMYMRAGNSITVNVIEEILENLLYDRKQAGNQLSMF